MKTRKAMMTTTLVEGAMPVSTSPLPQWEPTTEPRSQLLPVVIGDTKENLHQKSLFKSFPPRETSSTATSSSSSATSSSSSPNEKSPKSTTSSNHEKNAFNRGEAATSIVVCGVDGTVYTLDAYTGHLKGMFASGPAVFGPLAEEEEGDTHAKETNRGGDGNNTGGAVDSHHHDSKNAITSSNNLSSSTSKDRILPGLNGYLYKISEATDDGAEERAIQELFPAKDVVDFPISACPENASTDNQQQQGCGIIIASKKTTIFAIDPTTGKVRWTQDPHGEAGGRGFTAHPPKSNAARGRAVLLQREDYAIRHLDADAGQEVWKLKLGQFSPLGFDVDDDDDSMKENNDLMFSRNASPAAAEGRTLLNGENHGYLTFGQDGPSLMAADGISGEVLWSRRIDSDIAAVYGIGKRRKWVSLETFDVTSDLGISISLSARSDGISPFGSRNNMEYHRIGRHGSHSYVITEFDVGRNPLQLSSSDVDHQILDNPGSLQLVTQNGRDYGIHQKKDDHFVPTKRNLSSMSSLKRTGRLIPYGAGQVNQLHRLGGHDSLLFVNPTNLNNPDFPHSMQVAHGYHAGEDLFSMTPFEMSMIDVRRPPPSHRTEHGLYLTWSMVAAVIMIFLSVIVFFARLIILRQKRKWESMPNLSQNAAKSSEDVYSNGGFIPSQAQTLNTPSMGSVNSWPKKYLPVTRSFSLGAIRTHSFSHRPIITERGRSDQNEDSSTIPGASTPAISPNTARSKAIPSEDSQDKSKPGVDNIDGIPLVRYSRYTSEFNEILALGRGGFGTVFRCRNVLDGREYAIKKIKITSPLSVSGNATKHLSQKLHRVLREVKCLALLDHPNIVRYYTAWLEVDNGAHGDDDETNTISSIFDRNSLVTGFESFSRAMQQSFLPKRNKCQRPAKELKELSNPLGWNNFGSLRLDESKSEASLSVGAQLADATEAVFVHDNEDDLGFIWERSKGNSIEPPLSAKNQSLGKHNVEDKHSSSSVSVADTIENENGGLRLPTSRPVMQSNNEAEKSVQLPQAPTDVKTSVGRHILFIQMQLCSVQTLADFLANHEARGGVVSQSSSNESRYAVDIPLAIRLFAQIAHGVKYVHKQGLIHRDLKPQNCFIDDAGIVKVGDFGLSRESSAAGSINDFDESDKDDVMDHNDSFSSITRSDAENTVGVGTRAYASPEQMRGSDYDASTDVFSLGLILFELCYPMYTSMERFKEFTGIRQRCFPAYWAHVQTSFPTLHELLIQMITETASERPSADVVSDRIDSLLREYSAQSLDKSWGEKGALLLRVEAEETEGVLAHSMKLIKDASPCAKVLQYGLRGQSSKAIMEFALDIRDDEKAVYVKNISVLLEQHGMNVRVIS